MSSFHEKKHIDPTAARRAWLEGRNDPLDPNAKLNTNEKLQEKWHRDYQQLRTALNRKADMASEYEVRCHILSKSLVELFLAL